MTVKSRKLEQSEATRAALIKTARKLFGRLGYAATDIETVARRTRVTRGALYHHFKDKRDLFSAVFDLEQQKLAEIGGEAAGAALSGSGVWDGMLAATNAFLDACLDPAVQRIVLIDALAVLGWNDGARSMPNTICGWSRPRCRPRWIKESSRPCRSIHWRI